MADSQKIQQYHELVWINWNPEQPELLDGIDRIHDSERASWLDLRAELPGVFTIIFYDDDSDSLPFVASALPYPGIQLFRIDNSGFLVEISIKIGSNQESIKKIGSFVHIKRMILEYAVPVMIEDCFESFQELTTLAVKNPLVQPVPDSIQHCTELSTIDMQLPCRRIPEWLGNLTQLTRFKPVLDELDCLPWKPLLAPNYASLQIFELDDRLRCNVAFFVYRNPFKGESHQIFEESVKDALALKGTKDFREEFIAECLHRKMMSLEQPWLDHIIKRIKTREPLDLLDEIHPCFLDWKSTLLATCKAFPGDTADKIKKIIKQKSIP
jgi:hypothetical protein